jgi:hypothetical protein
MSSSADNIPTLRLGQIEVYCGFLPLELAVMMVWLCCKNRVRASFREVSMVAELHEQTYNPDI